MKKTIIIFLFFSVQIFSQEYLPLKVGNKWNFAYHNCNGSPVFSTDCHEDTLINVVIENSTMPNGLEYYRIDYLTIGFYSWFRSDTNWVYAYEDSDSTDVPILKLHSVEEEIIELSIDGYPQSIFHKKDTINIFGYDIETLSFTFETGWDITNEIVISKKFGFISVSNIGYGGWGGRTLLGCEIDGVTYGNITGIKNINVNIPKKIELYQNYPNPFNPTTLISFQIPISERRHAVSLYIYDIVGRKVATLIENKFLSGYREIEFNASNLSSGIYFYRLTSNNFVSTKKMLLIK